MKKNQMLMTSGTIWKQMLLFAFPVFLGNLFQQLYNTADSLIVGNYLGSSSLAAVTSCGELIFLLTSLFQGISVGAGVVIARYFGANDKERMQNAIHTLMAFGIVFGIGLTVFGYLLAPVLLGVDVNTKKCDSFIRYISSNLFSRFSRNDSIQFLCWYYAVGRR
ncbi:MATE family efflux transporter [Holdemanella biformis]